MAINRRLQFVRGNTARNNAFVGREGELTVDTTTWTLRVHDGVTPGGNALGTSNFSGDYDDLTNKPTIPADVSDLTDTGGILSSGFSGAYADLTGAPVIPTDLSDLTDDSNLIPTDISQLGDATGVIPTDVSDLTDTHNIILTLPQIIAGMATESYVDDAISNLVNAAPGTLDTLNELAAAIGDDPNYAATVSGLIGAKANTADLSTVATTGSYNHLIDKPFIPYDANELTDADGLFTGNPFDQDLNTTDSPQFNRVGLTAGEINVVAGTDFNLYTTPDGETVHNLNFTTAGDLIIGALTVNDGAVQTDTGNTLGLYAGANAAISTDGGNYEWNFGTDGALTLPSGYIKPDATDGFLTIEGPLFADMVQEEGGGIRTITNGVKIRTHRAFDDLDRDWNFSWDGAIYAPRDASNSQVGAIEWRTDNIISQVRRTEGGTLLSGRVVPPGLMLFSNNTGAVSVLTGGDNYWTFDGDGSLTFPDDTVQTTAYTGAYADLTGAPTTVSSFTNDTGYVASDTTGITGADQVTNMVTLTQAEYDAITPNASTVYFIVG